MSLVGNFTTNFDRSVETSGAGSPTRVRRRSFFADEESQAPESLTRKRTRSITRPRTEESQDTVAAPATNLSQGAPTDHKIRSEESSSDEEDKAHVRELARQYTRQS